MSATIWLRPFFRITYATPTPGTVLDLSCYTYAVELASEVEEIDIGNFCAPYASDQGIVTYTASASMLWEPALYTAMLAHLREVGDFELVPNTAVPTEKIKWSGAFANSAWGRYEVGQRVEVEVPIAVFNTPVWLP